MAKQAIPREPKHHSPQKPAIYQNMPENYPSPHRPDSSNYYANVPRRQGYPMPLPTNNVQPSREVVPPPPPMLINADQVDQINSLGARDNAMLPAGGVDPPGLYSEPYRCYENLQDQFDRIDIAEVGLPLEELTERQIQEAKVCDFKFTIINSDGVKRILPI